ncbi:MAG: hypothetical protein MUF31_08965 [Akkermansiaceae bacterium]|jgi:hypothetical protein|nr:hypothetical protein [Akkermansiaceae bacterium]
MSETDPRTAALSQTREHGLWGRADSPTEWQAALDGATPGDPVLVKSPDDRRDDFFLVPMQPRHPAARTAWVILDRVTLKLREASLLDHWPVPAFPDEKDRTRLSQMSLILPDGTPARFRADDLRPNLKNLVWKPTEAAILPYRPIKEFIAAHPLTREPISLYLTQEGDVLTDFDGEPQETQETPRSSRKSFLSAGLITALITSVALTAWIHHQRKQETPVPPAPVEKVKAFVTNSNDSNDSNDQDHTDKSNEDFSSGDDGSRQHEDEQKLWKQIDEFIDLLPHEGERVKIRRDIRAGLDSLPAEKSRVGYLLDCLAKLQASRLHPPDAEPKGPKPSH